MDLNFYEVLIHAQMTDHLCGDSIKHCAHVIVGCTT